MPKIFTKVIVHTVSDLTNHWLSEIVIWLYLLLFLFNALLSLFLTADHYSFSVFFPATGTKAGAIKGCHTWMSLTFSDTECPVEICQPQTWSYQDSQALGILPFGAAPPGFQPGLEETPPTFPFTVWSRNGCEITRMLESWPFWCALSMHGNCSTRTRCVDTFCSHLSLIYRYRKDAWNVPVFFLTW